MTGKPLEILSLLREVTDPRPPAQLADEGAMIRDRGLRRLLNPADLEALELALTMTEKLGGRVTALVVGPERVEDGLRLALAMGAARAVRVWDHGCEGADAVAQARVLARTFEILRPDLVLAGSRLLDRGDDPAPSLAAALLGMSCAPAAVSLTLGREGAEVTRKADRGARQRLALPLPCAVWVEPGFHPPRYPDFDGVLRSLEAEVERWGLPELGLPGWAVGEWGAALRPEGVAFPRPQPLRVSTPAADLPAPERIGALLSGGIVARGGVMHRGSADEIAEGLLCLLAREGLVPGRSWPLHGPRGTPPIRGVGVPA